jgi:hypothetical protein
MKKVSVADSESDEFSKENQIWQTMATDLESRR